MVKPHQKATETNIKSELYYSKSKVRAILTGV